MTPEVFTRFIYWLYIIVWILLGMMIVGTVLIGIWALIILVIHKRRRKHGRKTKKSDVPIRTSEKDT